jgi:uncharacterized protein (DUF2336 family)
VSVQVILEADSRLTKSGVVSLLRKMGAEVIEDDELMDPDDLEIRAWLPLSSMSMDGRVQRDRRIAAENPGDANFDVAYRCAFTMNASDYEACMADIDKFSEAIADELGAHFVVSWQLERTLLTNSSTGLRRFALN